MLPKLSSFSLILALPSILLWLLFLSLQPAQAIVYIVGTPPCVTTIQACINLAAAGDTVQIPSGTYNESLTLLSPINLQGAAVNKPVIQPPAGQRGLLISGAAIAANTIIENIIFTGANIYGGGNSCVFDECGAGIAIQNEAFPILRNLDVNNNQAYKGAGIYLEPDTSLILEDSTVANNSAVFVGGGIGGDSNVVLPITQTMIIRDSFIIGNDATQSGGGISWGAQPANNYTFVISNSTIATNTMTCLSSNCNGAGVKLLDLVSATVFNTLFQENSCFNNGGNQCSGGGLSILAFRPMQVTMTATNFISNTAEGAGGGMVSGGVGDGLSISEGTWSGNTAGGVTSGGATYGGGALRVSGDNITISGTQFISNTAQGSGGAIVIGFAPTFQVTNAAFEKNRSQAHDGGAIAVLANVHLQVTNTTFIDNAAADDGGAITTWDIGIAQGVTAVDSTFSNNAAALGDGGAIRMRGDLNLMNTDFADNTAEGEGGAVYLDLANTGVHQVTGGLFQENSAQASGGAFSWGGGALNIGAGRLTISGSQFLTNSAPANSGYGGAILVGIDMTATNTIFQGNQAIVGGAIGTNPFASGIIMNLNDTTLIANQASGVGGGAVLVENAQFNGGLVQGNSTPGSGGGVYTDGWLRMTGTQVLSNTAGTRGGGIYAQDPITLTSVLVQDNQVSGGDGGGISFSVAFEESLISGTQVINNMASNNGGGIDHFGNLILINSNLEGNTAVNGDGGGLNTGFSVFMTNTTVLSNTAGGDGGGMDVNSALRLYSGRFQGNTSGRNGGGVYAGSTGPFENAVVINNQAQDNGGGMHVYFLVQGMRDSLFQENVAQDRGGGLYVGLSTFTVDSTRFISNAANLGGGLSGEGTSGTLGSKVVNSVFSRN
ncbi:MAG: hypothetical protein GY796_29125, partial [Chloroflexi bacterium]|nr:hypothetical protein [Chloroflexota bacterium]